MKIPYAMALRRCERSTARTCVAPFDLDRFAERKAKKMPFDHILHLCKTACILGFDLQRQSIVNRLEPACTGRKRNLALDGRELDGQLMRKVQLMVRVYRLGSLVLDNAMGQAAAHGLSFAEFEVLVTPRGMAAPHELMPTEPYSAV
jgi:hypothetical protein